MQPDESQSRMRHNNKAVDFLTLKNRLHHMTEMFLEPSDYNSIPDKVEIDHHQQAALSRRENTKIKSKEHQRQMLKIE